jgi:hypothetical protein
METILNYDAWKLASPEECLTQGDINELEIKLLERNLGVCPFCLARPFFEDSAHTEEVCVSCHCGAQMRGTDWHDVAAKWSTRPIPVARNVVREGPRAYGTWR